MGYSAYPRRSHRLEALAARLAPRSDTLAPPPEGRRLTGGALTLSEKREDRAHAPARPGAALPMPSPPLRNPFRTSSTVPLPVFRRTYRTPGRTYSAKDALTLSIDLPTAVGGSTPGSSDGTPLRRLPSPSASFQRRSKGQKPRLYVSFPLSLAAAIGLEPGEEVRWELLDRGELHIRRRRPQGHGMTAT